MTGQAINGTAVPIDELFAMKETATGAVIPVRDLQDDQLARYTLEYKAHHDKLNAQFADLISEIVQVASAIQVFEYEMDRRSREDLA